MFDSHWHVCLPVVFNKFTEPIFSVIMMMLHAIHIKASRYMAKPQNMSNHYGFPLKQSSNGSFIYIYIFILQKTYSNVSTKKLCQPLTFKLPISVVKLQFRDLFTKLLIAELHLFSKGCHLTMQPWKGTCPFAHQRNYFVFDVYITVYVLYIISPVYWYTLHSAVSMIYNQRASCNFHLLLDLVACESSSPCFVVSAPSKSCRTPSPPRAGQGTCNKHTNISKPKMFSMHVWKANINYHKLILVCMCIYIYTL